MIDASICVEAVWFRMKADSGCAESVQKQVLQMLFDHDIAEGTKEVAARLEQLK